MTTQHTHDERSDVENSVADYTSNLPIDSSPAEMAAPVSSENPEDMASSASFASPTPAAMPEGDAQTVTASPASEEVSQPTAGEEMSHQEDAVSSASPADAEEAQPEFASNDMTASTVAQTKSEVEAQSAPVAPENQAMLETSEFQVVQEPITDAQATPDTQEVQTEATPTAQVAAHEASAQQPEEVILDTTSANAVEPLAEVTPATADTVQESQATAQEPSLLDTARQEDVRSFIDFIAEFQQEEEARFNRQDEPFSLLETTSMLMPTPDDEAVFFSVTQDMTGISAAAEELHEPVQEVAIEQSEPVALVDEQPIASAAAQETVAEEQKMPQVPTIERPPSPLLRPASRPRMPRHGGLHSFVKAQEEQLTTPEQPSEQVEQGTQIVQKPAAEQEPTRPPRRYRFDRPATHGQTPTSPSSPLVTRSEEPKETPTRVAPVSPRAENSISAETQPKVAATNGNGAHSNNGNHTAEKQNALPAQPVAQEAASSENTPLVATPEQGRRRHGQERSREKEQAAPVVSTPAPESPEFVAPVTEQTPSMIEEIAPEDLPPLEYAELQKAAGRRRRRHRTTTPTNATPAPITNVAPVAAEAPKVETPAVQNTPSPIAPVATSSSVPAPVPNKTNDVQGSQQQFTIVSGYTVNQMNQGNDMHGPFMGPDPSPARGSVLSRDGRTMNRAETQRTPIYTARSTDGVSPSSIQQLASVLSQAVQTQTDRMVAELRRANQAPTNVSVTLPPFPSTERVGVFVDVANLLYSARTMRIAVDFGKLLDFLRGNRRLVRAHAYCPTSPQAGDEQMFLQAVKGLGYRITTKNYKTFASGAKKADLDLDLCMDVVRLVDGRAVDCVVLVSGDSDFMPMLDYCSDHGVRVEVAAFDEAMSATLRQSCDLFINLSMLEEIRS